MTRLVTSQEIKNNTPMGGNVDPDKFLNFIDDVQVMILEPILGTKLFDKILTDFEADSLTGLYLQIVDDYLKKIISYSVFSDYVTVGSVTVGNGGVYRKTSDDAQLASEDEINSIAKSFQSKADIYIGRLDRFLCDQEPNIPEYTTNQDNDYDIDPRHNVRTISGWHFGRDYDYDWRVDNPNSTTDSGNNLELE